MLRIAIDGACRNNGKPNCIAAGGIFIQHNCTTDTRSNYEYGSTNQRGELLALLTALDYIHHANQEAQVITDSEYIFNAMTKQWYDKWFHSGWKTAAGEQVKNADLWQEIRHAIMNCEYEIDYYHIKGHVIPFGKVTAENLLHSDATGKALKKEVADKFDLVKSSKADNISVAQELSIKNNGFCLDEGTLKEFVVANTVADAVATVVVEAAARSI